MQPAVYILASQRNGTLYIGVTSNLVQRIWQHKNDLVEGFTEKLGEQMAKGTELDLLIRQKLGGFGYEF